MTKEQILQQFGGSEDAFYAQFPNQGDWEKFCNGGMVKKKIPAYGNGGMIKGTTTQKAQEVQPAFRAYEPLIQSLGSSSRLWNKGYSMSDKSMNTAEVTETDRQYANNNTYDAPSRFAFPSIYDNDRNQYFRENPMDIMKNVYRGRQPLQYGKGGKIPSYNFGGTVNVLDARNGAIDSTKQGINQAASIYGTAVGEVANVAAMVATAGASGAAGGGSALGAQASQALTTAKAVNNAQTGGNLNTGGGIGDAIGGKDVSGIGGMVKSGIELQGKVVAELFGKAISDTQNRSIYAGLGQTNQAKEKYLGIENTADVYGQRPGSMMANGGMTVPHGGNLYGPSHEGGGIPIEAEGGEAVIKKEAVKKFAPILSAINQSVGGNPITPGQSTSYAEDGTLVPPYQWKADEKGFQEQRSWQEDELLMKQFENEKSYNPEVYGYQRGFDYGDDVQGNQDILTDVLTRKNQLPTDIGGPTQGYGTPIQMNPNQPGFNPWQNMPNNTDGSLLSRQGLRKEDESTDTTQYEPKPGYGMEAVQIGSNIASLVNNALQRYDAGPKPIPMTAEEERTNRFVERNNDLNNIGISAATQIASNKTSSASGKLAASLGVYSNIIDKKMDSEAKWYGEEEAAKNRNIALRNTVSNSNRMELNAYNANEANNRNQFKQTKAQMIFNDVNNAVETASNWDESRKADATSMIQMEAYSRMIQIPQLTAQWNASKELRTKYNSPSDYINAAMDQNQFNNEMSKYPRYFRPVKTKRNNHVNYRF